jgi:RNA polymerase sigma-70 factor (ECF subfamily)
LVARALKGDIEAKTRIVLLNQDLVYNIALKLMSNPDGAENVLQETFLKVFEKLDTFKGNSSLQTWIYRIATNEALMLLRRKKGDIVPLEEDPDSDQKAKYESMLRSVDRDPLELMMDSEFKGALERAMSELPDSWRIPFVLKDIEGLSLQEVADTLGTTVPAVKAALHRGRSALRDQLAEFVDRRKETSP